MSKFNLEEFSRDLDDKQEIMQQENDNKKCDTKCEILSKFVEEMNKQRGYKDLLIKLPRQKIGILQFNTSEASEEVIRKIDDFFMKLKKIIKQPKEDLENYLQDEIKESQEVV